MNPYHWEKDKSLTSPTHVLSKGEVTAVAPNIFPHQGIPDATRIHSGYKEMDACRRPNARANSYSIYLHKCHNEEKAHGRESAVGKPHLRYNSSTQVIFDRPPSQPRRCHRIRGEPRHISVKESYKDLGAGEAHQRGSSALKRQSDSKWNSGSGALTDRPPLQPFIRHGISEASCASTKEYHTDPSDDSRWSSGYPSNFDMSPFQALAGSSLKSLQYDDSSWTSGYRTT
jgi:hypothetical protein